MADIRCPRGVKTAEEHRRQQLVHRLFRGRMVCMFAEVAEETDKAGVTRGA